MPQTEIETNLKFKTVKEEEIPHLLVPGEFGAVLELIVKDEDGKVTEKRVMKSQSFVKQFLELLWIYAIGLGEWNSPPYQTKDYSGQLYDMYQCGLNLACNGGIGVTYQGPAVGTGTTAPTITDYALQAQIAHGTGAGQLSYGAVAFGAPASDTSITQFTITRDFANSSGGAITVNEIGLFVRGGNSPAYYFLAIRDVISGGISVPNGQTMTVNYREQVVT